MDELGLHVFQCSRSGLGLSRHNFVKNDIANIFTEAGFSTFVEDMKRCWRAAPDGTVNPKKLRMDVIVEGFETLGVPFPLRDSTGPVTPQCGLPLDVTITSVDSRNRAGARLDQPNTFLGHDC